MKKFILSLFILFSFISCETEVIEVIEFEDPTKAENGNLQDSEDGSTQDHSKTTHSTGEVVSFKVKEAAGVGVSRFPVTKVFPLEKDKYFDLDSFYIVDETGEIINAQFEVVDKWWMLGGSLRHIKAHFLVDVEAFKNSAGSGIASYTLMSGSGQGPQQNPIKVKDKGNLFELTNGLIKIDIQKSPLIITTPAGPLKSIFKKEDGTIDESFSHSNIEIEIEEEGPIRSVVKISSATIYNSPTDIKHGWALRLYAYADSEFIKVDFQLQNSAINTALSAPLYFQGHKLTLITGASNSANSIKAQTPVTADVHAKPIGLLKSTKANVVMRDFWERFPNGLSVSSSGNVDIEFWPEWGNQFHDNAYSSVDIYWLDDMRHCVKEAYIDFKTSRDSLEVTNLAKSFQFPPVGVIGLKYYGDTKVTLDMGGHVPESSIVPQEETNRLPVYTASNYNIASAGSYRFSTDNFGLDVNRKRATNMTGGVPYTNTKFYVSGNPADFYASQNSAMGELNIRPEWLANYKHDSDQALIEPTTNPYGGGSWRRFKGHGVPTATRSYLEGTTRTANPRDDQHGWFYHIEDAYFLSGNLWIKDWYEFVSEFRKTFLNVMDPWPDSSNRGKGHALAHALAAYKVTGKTEIIDLALTHYQSQIKPILRGPYKVPSSYTPSGKYSAASFQLGYLIKPYVTLYYESGKNKEILDFIKGNVSWINDISNYGYYMAIEGAPGTKGGGTGQVAVDPVSWYILETGDKTHLEKVHNFVTIGIGGGKPYGSFAQWTGGYQSRIYRTLVEKYNP